MTDVHTLLEKPNTVDDDVKRHLHLYHPGTREWVFKKLDSWAGDEAKKAYWVNGTGGLGKSVIAAEYFRRSRDNKTCGFKAVVGFFCRHNDALRNDPRAMLLSLAYQLAQQLPVVKEALEQNHEEIAASLKDSSVKLSDLFDLLLADPLKKTAPEHRILIVIDALDELQQNTQRTLLLQLVGQQFHNLPSNAKVLVTSRPENYIVMALEKLDPLPLVKHEEGSDDFAASKEQQADVRKYLQDKLTYQPFFLKHPKILKKELDALLKETQGVFLTARLLVAKAEELDEDTNKSDALKQLRAGMTPFKAYGETLDRIDQRLRTMSGDSTRDYELLSGDFKTILDVLVCSKEPLKWDDVAVFSSTYSGECIPMCSTRSRSCSRASQAPAWWSPSTKQSWTTSQQRKTPKQWRTKPKVGSTPASSGWTTSTDTALWPWLAAPC